MNFFDDLLNDVQSYLASFDKKVYPYGKPWRDLGRNELVLGRDAQYELDGFGFNLVTSNPIGDSEVVVIGPELNQIKSETKFARVSIIEMNDIDDEQKAYNLIRKIEYAKYHYFPEGFMVRTASTTHKEMARVSKKALSSGLSFEGVGNLLISKYKENDAVKNVKVIYISNQAADFDKLEKIAEKNYNITEALNHVLSNVNFDCNSCNLKAICDEVEGMKELHFKNSGMG